MISVFLLLTSKFSLSLPFISSILFCSSLPNTFVQLSIISITSFVAVGWSSRTLNASANFFLADGFIFSKYSGFKHEALCKIVILSLSLEISWAALSSSSVIYCLKALLSYSGLSGTLSGILSIFLYSA